MKITTINPATEEPIKTYNLLVEKDLDEKINAAHDSYDAWRKTDFSHKAQLMKNLADILEAKKQDLALMITTEMGKPIKQAILEIEKCRWNTLHFMENAQEYLKPRSIGTNFKKTTVYCEPLGIVFAIMPWNFPFWQVFRFAIPAILAGNSVILKHAEIVSGCSLAIENLFREAQFPPNLFQSVIINSKLAPYIIANDKIRAVTLTGSERAGKSVASSAGLNVKKVVLELGGSDPYVILKDADLDLAAKTIVASRLNNTGQVCIAAKRAIIVKEVYDELLSKILEEFKKYKGTNPLDPEAKMGPLARGDLRDNLQKQVMLNIEQGAKLLCGGSIPEGKGFYYPPTVLADVEPHMCAFDEEMFGPVLAVTKAENQEHAIKLANMSKYGLGAAVFTQNLEEGEKIARFELHAGSAFVNALVSSDPRVPFGGIKHSGFGRELSLEGIREFVNVKTVSVN